MKKSVIICISTLSIVKQGEKDFIDTYYGLMMKSLNNEKSVEIAKKLARQAGVHTNTWRTVLEEMRNDYICLDITDEQLALLDNQKSVKDFLLNSGRFFRVEDEKELENLLEQYSQK